jgi:FHS family L-fucose permease-like MFS transporter
MYIWYSPKYRNNGKYRPEPKSLHALQASKNTHITMAIPMTGYMLAMTFPIYMNIFNKDMMDSHRNIELSIIVPVGKILPSKKAPIKPRQL